MLKVRCLIYTCTEVLEEMVKNKLEVDAVDIAYTLEVENFPQKTLIAFLHESEETWKRAKKEANGSSAAMVPSILHPLY